MGIRSKASGSDLTAVVHMLERDVGGECPMVRLLDTLSGKWSFPILYSLIQADAPIRFRELQRRVRPITQKELTKHLRSFEMLGLVRRTIYAEVPARVEYSISDYGKTLSTPLAALARWSIERGRPLFDAKANIAAKG
jgi:DNA-binding HxlR family transcriptional regulator